MRRSFTTTFLSSSVTREFPGALLFQSRSGSRALRSGMRANVQVRPALGRPSMVSPPGPWEQVRVSALGESLAEAEVGEVRETLAARTGTTAGPREAQAALVEVGEPQRGLGALLRHPTP